MDILVSVIIVNYNTEKVLKDCLKSIEEKSKNINYEIIVIDNDSEKGSLSDLIDAFPDVNFQLMEKNLGFGTANNVGVDIAKGKYLYFLNPDTVLLNNALYVLSQYMQTHPETGICGGSMYNEDMTPTSAFYDIDHLALEYEILFNIRKNYQGINETNRPKDVQVIVGSNLFTMKNIFLEVGGFDEDFFMYFEEVELCDRVRKANYCIMSVPDAKIIHLHGASAENKNDELKSWTRLEHWYSKFVYFYKTKGGFQTKLLHSAHVAKFKLAVMYYKMKNNENKLHYWNSKEQTMEKSYSRYKIYLKNK